MLSKKDKAEVQILIDKAKNANSIEELKVISKELKKIEVKSRMMDITNNVLDKYR